MSDVTQILSQIQEGDAAAAERLLLAVYDELRRLAAARLAHEKPGQTLTSTALVHEAYLRLVDTSRPQAWNSRGHFFGAAAEAMRRILVENARRKQSERHGGKLRRQDANLDQVVLPERSGDILEIDEALRTLEKLQPAVARLVELRYFAGLKIDEAASLMGISDRTARRYWTYAKAWLRDAINRQREA